MENNTPNTDNFLNWVEIKNFKSIKDLRLDCKRVNVFIGKPNVGKSNILEGLGLLGSQVLFFKNEFYRGALRYKKLKDLFYDSEHDNDIHIVSNLQKAILSKSKLRIGDKTTYEFTVNGSQNKIGLTDDGTVDKMTLSDDWLADNSLKKYDFANLTEFKNSFQDFLLPPDGSNLYAVVRRNKELLSEFAKLFTEQKLELVLYDEKQEFILQKRIDHYAFQYPFFSIADTFRRFIFYITAIESNKNSVIVIEEPEVHSFPPYVKAMAHRIVSSEENQFFISTHSPYLLQTLIGELDESELAVYITYYKDYQTHVRQLTAEELQEAQDLSIDLFYNLSRYEPNA